MAIPSSNYSVDTTTTLANGTELKWTKQIKNIYPNLNDSLDRTCTYSEMSSPVLNKTGYAFKQNLLTDQYTPSYGSNGSNTRWAKGFLRNDGWTKNIWYGSVLVDTTANSSNIRRYFFGYTDTSASIINASSGGNARILRDIKVNKLLFNVTIKGYKVSDYNNIDYTANPFSSQAPSEVTIKLSELDANPNGYIITMIYYNNTLVYGPNGAQKWLGSSVSPAFICYSSDVGGFHWIPFSVPTPNFSYSYQTQNGHPNWTGSAGGVLPVNLAYNYVFGCDNSSMKLELPDTFANIDQSLQTLALTQYGYDSSWTHSVYFSKKLHNFGDYRCIELIYGNVAHSSGNPGSTSTNSIQTSLMLGITGEAANKMIAGLGLYFCDGDEDFDPNDESITPDTMYTSQHIWLGEMSGHGITTGRWVKGSDIENYSGPNKNGDINDSDYNPGSGGGGEKPGDDYVDMALGVSNLTLGGLTKYAIVSKQELIDLVIDYNTNGATAGTNFSNHIICLYRLGFGAGDLVVTNSEKIKMIQSSGNVDFESSANYSIVTRQTPFIHFGSITVPRHTGTFYDFSPYSNYELYIPGCGWIPLPDNVAGRTLNVYLVFDLPTCSAKGIVRIAGNVYGGTTIATVNGIIGASVPFTIGENGMQRAAILSGSVQTAAALGTAFLGVGIGNPYMGASGVAMATTGIANNYVAGNTNFISTKGGASDFSAFGDGAGAILKYNAPEIDPVVNNSMFGHTVGYLCNEVGKLSNFTGFTVCDNPHVTFSASSAERDEIERLLSMGVIL